MLYAGKICLLFAHVLRLWKTQIKGGTLINLEEDISRQPNIQLVARVWMVAFSQTYRENKRQKEGQKNLKLLKFGLTS